MSTQSATLEQIRYWFLQKVLPMYLLLSAQCEILHAGAVEMEGNVAAFLGASGIGKSTLTAYLVSQGHNLFADEHLVLKSNSTTAIPTIPYLRPRRQLESLGDYTTQFHTSSRPLSCLYVLAKAEPQDAVSIEQMYGSAAIAAVCLRQQFNLSGLKESPTLRPLLSERFAVMARLAEKVPVKRVAVPRSLARLPEVYTAIHEDMACNTALPLEYAAC